MLDQRLGTEETIEQTEEPVEQTEEPVEQTEGPVEQTEEPVEQTEEERHSKTEDTEQGETLRGTTGKAEQPGSTGLVLFSVLLISVLVN